MDWLSRLFEIDCCWSEPWSINKRRHITAFNNEGLVHVVVHWTPVEASFRGHSFEPVPDKDSKIRTVNELPL